MWEATDDPTAVIAAEGRRPQGGNQASARLQFLLCAAGRFW